MNHLMAYLIVGQLLFVISLLVIPDENITEKLGKFPPAALFFGLVVCVVFWPGVIYYTVKELRK